MTAQVEFVTFKTQLSRFVDRPIVGLLQGKTAVRFFKRTGGAIRVTAKRKLRKASQKSLAELTRGERIAFQRWQDDFRSRRTSLKPRRPERTAKPGNPPLLHTKPKSPLRELIFFFVADDGRSVVIGPAQSRGGNLQRLEANNPFMAPAFQLIQPKLPQFLAAAAGK
jgi:hypothetical protein